MPFPANPVIDDVYPTVNPLWKWNGAVWARLQTDAPAPAPTPSGTPHKDTLPAQRHAPHSWVVDDAAERLALTPDSTDVDKWCLQKDNYSQWMLVSYAPPIWHPDNGDDSGDGTSDAAFAPGDILYTTGNKALPEWLPCNGTTHLPDDYPELSEVLGVEDAAGEWLELTGAPTGIKRITYGNGRFVGLGDYSAATSLNGVSWTTSTVNSVYWSRITYGNGVFVATLRGYTNLVGYSEDGIAWTTGTKSDDSACETVAYGAGIFVIIADAHAKSYWSIDGLVWNDGVTSIPSSNWSALSHANGRFMTTSKSADYTLTSIDGSTWTQVPMVLSSASNDVAFGNGRFIAVRQTSMSYYLHSPVFILPTIATVGKIKAYIKATP